MNTAADVWKAVLEYLASHLTSTAITTWFSDCEAVELKDNLLILHTSAPFKKDIIESRFSNLICEALKELFCEDFEIAVLDDDGLAQYQNVSSEEKSRFTTDKFTFENFIVGPSNKFAHAAAIAVADGSSDGYNPLFIYGASGLGKTHLMYAIGNRFKKNNPSKKIVYIKGDDFTNELIHAIQTGKNIEFRDKYRSADLFMVDDIQFIAGKVQTQEEFFHTFNTLYESGKQIVLASDRPPDNIQRLEERLKTRFQWGLLADIQAPDYETRVAIVKYKAKEYGIILSDEICSYIAENITSNVRQIEGVVKKLEAYSALLDSNVNEMSVLKSIKDVIRKKPDYLPTPEFIIEQTASYYSLTPKELTGRSRVKNVVLARQVAMHLIRELTGLSLQDIGAIFDRDHTTVMHATEKVKESIQSSLQFAEIIKDITTNINSKL